MPFLLVIKKEKFPEVRSTLLTELLCPYVGDITKIENENHQLFYSAVLQNNKHQIKLNTTLQTSLKGAPNIALFMDTESIRIERDEMAMCPLWIFENEQYILLSPEFKSFCAVAHFHFLFKDSVYTDRKNPIHFTPFQNIQRVPPSSSFVISKKGMSEVNSVDVNLEKLNNTDPAFYIEKIKEVVSVAKQSYESLESVSTLLSGGIDSSLVNAILSNRKTKVSSYTLGTTLGNEFLEATEVANYLQTNHSNTNASDDEIQQSFKQVIWENEIIDGLSAEVIAQINTALLLSKQQGCFYTGYGSDLLLGGMLSHKAYLAAIGVTDEQDLIHRTFWTNEFAPFYHWKNNIQLVHFYWQKSIVECFTKIPLELNNKEFQKHVLRSFAVQEKYLTPELSFRVKKGMTNGTMAHIIVSKLLGLDANYHFNEKTKFAFDLIKKKIEVYQHQRQQTV